MFQPAPVMISMH